MTVDRVTYVDGGALDEIVGAGPVHLERLGKNRWFLEIGHADGTSTAVWFKSNDLPTLLEKRTRKRLGMPDNEPPKVVSLGGGLFFAPVKRDAG